MDEFQFVPPLFVLLFFGLGATMFASPYLWLYQVNRGQTDTTLSSDTMMNAARMLFVISIGSAIYNLLRPEANIMGEVILLTALVVYLTVYNLARKKKIWLVYATEFADTLFIFLVTCLFMVLTIVFAFMITKAMVVFNEQVAFLFDDPLRNAVFITGVIWIGSLFLLARNAGKKAEEDDRRVQFHNVLWPLAIGLLLVMTPLVVEQMSRDGKLEPEPPHNVLRRA